MPIILVVLVPVTFWTINTFKSGVVGSPFPWLRMYKLKQEQKYAFEFLSSLSCSCILMFLTYMDRIWESVCKCLLLLPEYWTWVSWVANMRNSTVNREWTLVWLPMEKRLLMFPRFDQPPVIDPVSIRFHFKVFEADTVNGCQSGRGLAWFKIVLGHWQRFKSWSFLINYLHL